MTERARSLRQPTHEKYQTGKAQHIANVFLIFLYYHVDKSSL